MNEEKERRKRIEVALARYEASHKAKRGKGMTIKLFSVDGYKPEQKMTINSEKQKES